jgi:hypothetical protein
VCGGGGITVTIAWTWHRKWKKSELPKIRCIRQIAMERRSIEGDGPKAQAWPVRLVVSDSDNFSTIFITV